MNDARLSAEFLSSERARACESFRAAAKARTAAGRTLGRPRGVLTVEDVAARTGGTHAVALEVQPAVADVASSRGLPPPRTAEQSMGLARLALAAVLVLVLCFVWIRWRRIK